eukprot:Cvel_33124.t2-p1 / transcript=Cvel_33124.t2 / gene=Cvel_33124 / organism=Chromera_velia_CCMP2878 / gene_product=hypothetical protein / transcript_product=hypothetical protein / location=Cvel_scaffold5300:4534-5277(+) / protein_length=248 / sequence_SO=supercontig / SO=protein_coding / is_pseudo=false
MGASLDYSTMDNIEVWAPNSELFFANGTGILISGVDGLRASNVAVFRAAVGIEVVSEISGKPEHPSWVSFSNILTDFCSRGLVISGSSNTVQLSAGSFQNHQTSLDIFGIGHSVRVSGSRFKSNGDVAVRIQGPNAVTMSGSGIERVFSAVKGVPAVSIGTDEGQTVMISGCDMKASAAVAVDCAGTPMNSNVQPVECAGGSVIMGPNHMRVNISAPGMETEGERESGWGDVQENDVMRLRRATVAVA